MERCDNCLYEYACDWSKAGDDLRCEEWKPEDVRMERLPMSRVMDKLIQLKKEYASYGEYDGIYAEDVQEIIDELLNDLNEDEKSQKILYQPQAYGTPWL